ncbi:indole-3-glycerol phosphate synthase TrpC [Moraxella bovis]|uniref:indole-3-glycerol phosphate synthase TrpC n=1 Tax=Moraxella bovis TaxID=476 RepID=UPI0022276334|nr:indole-3-glycerol phosphate synthase TrpC [Moraxella bovis]UYZ67734.1 indole-3-glycerol phosphate synthase TrpC [Moraxella bovis]UYZ70107.1 indole-3-glycerol phosphate synthase TrpC [Moraxella bovis]UYZ73981.1 indole-3-glycerol phosphate synthase TrpC [Moraxella bovis]UZA13398.1 indole-3-glycerol phosphate synthase TrpC [Moraxella bovis]UZA28247.1 indole-3-glycerol phosphate synthase TrpC [Moraxella bovis]
MSTSTILQKIVATKHQEIAQARTQISLDELKQKAKSAPTVRGFANALRAVEQGKIGVISEIKKASPSKGVICQNFDPIATAQGYESAGATCLSVLTDREYFFGHDDYLIQAKNACNLPALRKDFMVDEYHIYESRTLGADCILLIMACLDDETVTHLHKVAIELGMDVLIEIHDENELARALKLSKSTHNIYGINNRNLNTFDVDLNTSIRLAKTLRENVGDDALIVSESGIHGADDVHLMQSHGIHHFLIGEQFMKTNNAGLALQNLLKSI